MASKALEFRLAEAERQLAEFRHNASHLQYVGERLKVKIDALRSSFNREKIQGTPPPAASSPSSPSSPAQSSATPPPIPPEALLPPQPAATPVASSPSEAPPIESPSPAPKTPTTSAPLAPDLPPEKEGLELALGRVWFVRIGIGLLLTGFVFLSTYAYQNYIINWTAGARVIALYTAAIALTGTGFFLERWKESLRNYGRVVAAGGWAAIYYTTYAAHHLERLKVIDNAILAAVLLTFVAVGFFTYAAARKSSVLTVASLILAFYATAINPMGWLGSFSGLLLSTIGIFFFLRFSWMRTGLTSLLGAYLSYFYWHGFINPTGSDPTRWFLLGYWLLFTAGILAPQASKQSEGFRVGFASFNNIVFFLLFSSTFLEGWTETVGSNALVFGGVLVAISIALSRFGEYPALLRRIFLIKGLSLLTLGFTIEMSGHVLFLTLTIESLTLAAVSRFGRSSILRTFTWITAGIACLLALTSISPWGNGAPNFAYLMQGGLLIALALIARGSPFLDPERKHFSLEASLASLAGLLIPTIALSIPYHAPEVGLVMLGLGVTLWLAYLVKPTRWPLPELVWLGQLYAIVGAFLTLITSTTPWHFGLLGAIALIASQTHGLTLDREREGVYHLACRLFDFSFTAVALLSLAIWIPPGIDSVSTQLILAASIPLLGHLYGSFLNRPAVIYFSQPFHLFTLILSSWAWESSGHLDSPTQSAALIALLLVAVHAAAAHLIPRLQHREFFKDSQLIATMLLWAGWCLAFSDHWWFVLAWTAGALFLLPRASHTKALPATYLSLLTIGLAGVCIFESQQFWLRYLVLPVPFFIHLVQSRRDARADKKETQAQWVGLALFLILSLTVIASQHVLEVFDGKGLAICWALLGMAFFGLGLGVRVRAYRLGGLALLALSLGHVLIVDVWKLDTILRIFSFMTLGLVLLALGFIYNRWHESLRKLL